MSSDDIKDILIVLIGAMVTLGVELIRRTRDRRSEHVAPSEPEVE